MENGKKLDDHNRNPTLSYQELESRIKKIVERLIGKEDTDFKKRSIRKLLLLLKTLIDEGAISPLCISWIDLNLLQNEDIYEVLYEIFVEATKKWEIRNYIMLIEEFREYFPDIDFIHNSPEIQSAIAKDIEFLKSNRQNSSVLSKYLKK